MTKLVADIFTLFTVNSYEIRVSMNPDELGHSVNVSELNLVVRPPNSNQSVLMSEIVINDALNMSNSNSGGGPTTYYFSVSQSLDVFIVNSKYCLFKQIHNVLNGIKLN